MVVCDEVIADQCGNRIRSGYLSDRGGLSEWRRGRTDVFGVLC